MAILSKQIDVSGPHELFFFFLQLASHITLDTFLKSAAVFPEGIILRSHMVFREFNEQITEGTNELRPVLSHTATYTVWV